VLLRFGEWIQLPIAYKDLPPKAEIVITLYSTFAPKKAITIARTSFGFYNTKECAPFFSFFLITYFLFPAGVYAKVGIRCGCGRTKKAKLSNRHQARFTPKKMKSGD